MKSSVGIPVIVVSVAALSLFCGSSTQTVLPREDNPIEETICIDPYADSPEYDENPFEGFPVVTGLSIPSNVEATEGVSEVVSLSTEENLPDTGDAEIPGIPHYSVQITAATEEGSAQGIASILEGEVDYRIFVDRVDEYWKVRVGVFEERGDAEVCRDYLNNLGYTDAWVTTREP